MLCSEGVGFVREVVCWGSVWRTAVAKPRKKEWGAGLPRAAPAVADLSWATNMSRLTGASEFARCARVGMADPFTRINHGFRGLTQMEIQHKAAEEAERIFFNRRERR